MPLQNLLTTFQLSEKNLKPLQDIDGYLASAIFDNRGIVLIKHNASTYNIETVGSSVIALIHSSVETADHAKLGELQFLQINAEFGIFCVVWAVKNQSFATVLLGPKGNVGLAKLALVKLSEELENESL